MRGIGKNTLRARRGVVLRYFLACTPSEMTKFVELVLQPFAVDSSYAEEETVIVKATPNPTKVCFVHGVRSRICLKEILVWEATRINTGNKETNAFSPQVIPLAKQLGFVNLLGDLIQYLGLKLEVRSTKQNNQIKQTH